MTDPLLGPDGTVRIRRTFGWGIFFLKDCDETELPDYAPDKNVAVARRAISVSVRHEQDVDIGDEPFVVSVNIHTHASSPTSDSVMFRGVIDIPSGSLEIGDANEIQLIPLTPGRWSAVVATIPDDYPEQVDIWLSWLADETD